MVFRLASGEVISKGRLSPHKPHTHFTYSAAHTHGINGGGGCRKHFIRIDRRMSSSPFRAIRAISTTIDRSMSGKPQEAAQQEDAHSSRPNPALEDSVQLFFGIFGTIETHGAPPCLNLLHLAWPVTSPSAIAQLLLSLMLPHYFNSCIGIIANRFVRSSILYLFRVIRGAKFH